MSSVRKFGISTISRRCGRPAKRRSARAKGQSRYPSLSDSGAREIGDAASGGVWPLRVLLSCFVVVVCLSLLPTALSCGRHRCGSIMRILIAAVGRLKQGPERELAANYRKRAEAVGRSFGLRDIEIVEIRESRAQDVERRRTEESIAIANIIPERAVVAILDERGESLDSATLAVLLQRWR